MKSFEYTINYDRYLQKFDVQNFQEKFKCQLKKIKIKIITFILYYHILNIDIEDEFVYFSFYLIKFSWDM